MSNDTNTFTAEGRAEYAQELVRLSDEAKRYVEVNRGWDIAFKVLLLIIAILAIIGAAVAATYEKEPLPSRPMSNDTNTFTAEERAEYAQELVRLSDEAKRYVEVNRGWDIAFKVLLLIIAILAIIGAAVAATYEKEPLPSSLKILNVVTTGLATLLGGFAFSQFNFANRQAVWQKKQNMYITLRHQLLYTNPDKRVFITQVKTVREIDETSPTEPGPPKQPNSGG
jgi:Na+-transporting methylmalonyl-CoA/oxaloacetate decarboxylase gamma subunit